MTTSAELHTMATGRSPPQTATHSAAQSAREQLRRRTLVKALVCLQQQRRRIACAALWEPTTRRRSLARSTRQIKGDYTIALGAVDSYPTGSASSSRFGAAPALRRSGHHTGLQLLAGAPDGGRQ